MKICNIKNHHFIVPPSIQVHREKNLVGLNLLKNIASALIFNGVALFTCVFNIRNLFYHFGQTTTAFLLYEQCNKFVI